ncbi:MAG: peptidylprolyl isomerase [Faecousia sp.]
MSASSKKKLRNAEEAAKLTSRQIAEQKEAKKVKLYTTIFVVALVAMIAIAITAGVSQTITTSGMREKNTVAMTINGTELNNVELNYFYIDAVNNFYSQNGAYASLLGLDVTKPLNEQVVDAESGETWADNFLATAKSNATAVYALCEKANEAGHTLTEEEQQNLDSVMSSLDIYGSMYGYRDAKGYLNAMYGHGADPDTFRTYVEKTLLAQSYQDAYKAALTYEDADLRAYEADNFSKYSSFAYNYYYVNATNYLEGGTTAEDGTTTYSDEEKAASVAAAEEAAKALTAEDITTAEALNAAIKALPVNAENDSAASTRYDAQSFTAINSTIAGWLCDSSRESGDITYLENATTDAEGNKTINGYYVVRFDSVNDNQFPLKNVRHILVGFEGGTADDTGVTTYSDEEKAAAKAAAEELLNQWKSGEATEASFADLATENTTDTASAADGGLYEDICPGQMVTAFNDWCFDDSRKTGDTGIVETEYGYHVMYFVGDSDITYRDYQISNELRSADVNEWYAGIVDSASVADGNTKYLSLDLVISR